MTLTVKSATEILNRSPFPTGQVDIGSQNILICAVISHACQLFGSADLINTVHCSGRLFKLFPCCPVCCTSGIKNRISGIHSCPIQSLVDLVTVQCRDEICAFQLFLSLISNAADRIAAFKGQTIAICNCAAVILTDHSAHIGCRGGHYSGIVAVADIERCSISFQRTTCNTANAGAGGGGFKSAKVCAVYDICIHKIGSATCRAQHRTSDTTDIRLAGASSLNSCFVHAVADRDIGTGRAVLTGDHAHNTACTIVILGAGDGAGNHMAVVNDSSFGTGSICPEAGSNGARHRCRQADTFHLDILNYSILTQEAEQTGIGTGRNRQVLDGIVLTIQSAAKVFDRCPALILHINISCQDEGICAIFVIRRTVIRRPGDQLICGCDLIGIVRCTGATSKICRCLDGQGGGGDQGQDQRQRQNKSNDTFFHLLCVLLFLRWIIWGYDTKVFTGYTA